MIDKLTKTSENNDVQTLASQIKDKIKTKETEIDAPISYSVGKGDAEVVILAQPLQQETTIDDGKKTRKAKRTRYITVSSNGIGAVDFVTHVMFDASDNKPASTDFGVVETPRQFSPEGEYVDISQHTEKNNDLRFLRNLRGLNGVDKLPLASGVLGSVNIAEHNNDGLGYNNGQPVLSIGYDFQHDISPDVTLDELSLAFKLSTEKSKPEPKQLKVDLSTQVGLMSTFLSQS